MQRTQRNPDESEFHALFADYSERVYRWSLYMGLDTASAEEITQDVFVTVLKKTERPRNEPMLSAYLFQITRRHVANFRRSNWIKRVFGVGNASPYDLMDDAMGCEAAQGSDLDMRHMLATLPMKWVEVLLLHDLEGQSRREIAHTLNIAEGTVASRLRFARAAFIEKWTAKTNG